MRRWTGLAALAASTAATGLAVAIGIASLQDPEPSAPRPQAQPDGQPEPSSLSSYDTAGINVVRGPFCDRVSPTGIEHALGDVPADSDEWTDGDLDRLPDGTRDRVQEFGCRWTAADGTQASAWVFAPPVTRAEARELVRGSFGEQCATTQGDQYGTPSVASRCTTGAVTEDTLRGLFGDAWLTCTLATRNEPIDLPERTSEWCVQVVEAAGS